MLIDASCCDVDALYFSTWARPLGDFSVRKRASGEQSQTLSQVCFFWGRMESVQYAREAIVQAFKHAMLLADDVIPDVSAMDVTTYTAAYVPNLGGVEGLLPHARALITAAGQPVPSTHIPPRETFDKADSEPNSRNSPMPVDGEADSNGGSGAAAERPATSTAGSRRASPGPGSGTEGDAEPSTAVVEKKKKEEKDARQHDPYGKAIFEAYANLLLAALDLPAFLSDPIGYHQLRHYGRTNGHAMVFALLEAIHEVHQSRQSDDVRNRVEKIFKQLNEMIDAKAARGGGRRVLAPMTDSVLRGLWAGLEDVKAEAAAADRMAASGGSTSSRAQPRNGSGVDAAAQDENRLMHAARELLAPIHRRIHSYLASSVLPAFQSDPRFGEYVRLRCVADIMAKRTLCHDSFDWLRKLGRGGYGSVFAVRKVDTGRLYAIKCMDKRMIKMRRALRLVLTERAVLEAAESPFVTGLRFAFHNRQEVCLVLDMKCGGDLEHYLCKYGRFSERLVRFYMSEVLLGVAHLHAKGIMHRDLKPANILLDTDGHACLSDLGLACFVANPYLRWRARAMCSPRAASAVKAAAWKHGTTRRSSGPANSTSTTSTSDPASSSSIASASSSSSASAAVAAPSGATAPAPPVSVRSLARQLEAANLVSPAHTGAAVLATAAATTAAVVVAVQPEVASLLKENRPVVEVSSGKLEQAGDDGGAALDAIATPVAPGPATANTSMATAGASPAGSDPSNTPAGAATSLAPVAAAGTVAAVTANATGKPMVSGLAVNTAAEQPTAAAAAAATTAAAAGAGACISAPGPGVMSDELFHWYGTKDVPILPEHQGEGFTVSPRSGSPDVTNDKAKASVGFNVTVWGTPWAPPPRPAAAAAGSGASSSSASGTGKLKAVRAYVRGKAGTPGFWAPEMLLMAHDNKPAPYDGGADWWSFGCLLYALLAGRGPFTIKGGNTDDDNHATLNAEPPFPPEIFSATAKDLIQKLLHRDPIKRLGCGPGGATEVMRHPWFANVDWTSMENRLVTPPWKPEPAALNTEPQPPGPKEAAREAQLRGIILSPADHAGYESIPFTSKSAVEREIIENVTLRDAARAVMAGTATANSLHNSVDLWPRDPVRDEGLVDELLALVEVPERHMTKARETAAAAAASAAGLGAAASAALAAAAAAASPRATSNSTGLGRVGSSTDIQLRSDAPALLAPSSSVASEVSSQHQPPGVSGTGHLDHDVCMTSTAASNAYAGGITTPVPTLPAASPATVAAPAQSSSQPAAAAPAAAPQGRRASSSLALGMDESEQQEMNGTVLRQRERSTPPRPAQQRLSSSSGGKAGGLAAAFRVTPPSSRPSSPSRTGPAATGAATAAPTGVSMRGGNNQNTAAPSATSAAGSSEAGTASAHAGGVLAAAAPASSPPAAAAAGVAGTSTSWSGGAAAVPMPVQAPPTLQAALLALQNGSGDIEAVKRAFEASNNASTAATAGSSSSSAPAAVAPPQHEPDGPGLPTGSEFDSMLTEVATKLQQYAMLAEHTAAMQAVVAAAAANGTAAPLQQKQVNELILLQRQQYTAALRAPTALQPASTTTSGLPPAWSAVAGGGNIQASLQLPFGMSMGLPAPPMPFMHPGAALGSTTSAAAAPAGPTAAAASAGARGKPSNDDARMSTGANAPEPPATAIAGSGAVTTSQGIRSAPAHVIAAHPPPVPVPRSHGAGADNALLHHYQPSPLPPQAMGGAGYGDEEVLQVRGGVNRQRALMQQPQVAGRDYTVSTGGNVASAAADAHSSLAVQSMRQAHPQQRPLQHHIGSTFSSSIVPSPSITPNSKRRAVFDSHNTTPTNAAAAGAGGVAGSSIPSAAHQAAGSTALNRSMSFNDGISPRAALGTLVKSVSNDGSGMDGIVTASSSSGLAADNIDVNSGGLGAPVDVCSGSIGSIAPLDPNACITPKGRAGPKSAHPPPPASMLHGAGHSLMYPHLKHAQPPEQHATVRRLQTATTSSSSSSASMQRVNLQVNTGVSPQMTTLTGTSAAAHHHNQHPALTAGTTTTIGGGGLGSSMGMSSTSTSALNRSVGAASILAASMVAEPGDDVGKQQQGHTGASTATGASTGIVTDMSHSLLAGHASASASTSVSVSLSSSDHGNHHGKHRANALTHSAVQQQVHAWQVADGGHLGVAHVSAPSSHDVMAVSSAHGSGQSTARSGAGQLIGASPSGLHAHGAPATAAGLSPWSSAAGNGGVYSGPLAALNSLSHSTSSPTSPENILAAVHGTAGSVGIPAAGGGTNNAALAGANARKKRTSRRKRRRSAGSNRNGAHRGNSGGAVQAAVPTAAWTGLAATVTSSSWGIVQPAPSSTSSGSPPAAAPIAPSPLLAQSLARSGAAALGMEGVMSSLSPDSDQSMGGPSSSQLQRQQHHAMPSNMQSATGAGGGLNSSLARSGAAAFLGADTAADQTKHTLHNHHLPGLDPLTSSSMLGVSLARSGAAAFLGTAQQQLAPSPSASDKLAASRDGVVGASASPASATGFGDMRFQLYENQKIKQQQAAKGAAAAMAASALASDPAASSLGNSSSGINRSVLQSDPVLHGVVGLDSTASSGASLGSSSSINFRSPPQQHSEAEAGSLSSTVMLPVGVASAASSASLASGAGSNDVRTGMMAMGMESSSVSVVSSAPVSGLRGTTSMTEGPKGLLAHIFQLRPHGHRRSTEARG